MQCHNQLSLVLSQETSFEALKLLRTRNRKFSLHMNPESDSSPLLRLVYFVNSNSGGRHQFPPSSGRHQFQPSSGLTKKSQTPKKMYLNKAKVGWFKFIFRGKGRTHKGRTRGELFTYLLPIRPSHTQLLITYHTDLGV